MAVEEIEEEEEEKVDTVKKSRRKGDGPDFER